MAIQYDSDEERKLHFSAIHTIADRYHIDESTIREIYESELEKLKYNARVKSYLSVLAERHVKNILYESRVAPSEKVQEEPSY